MGGHPEELWCRTERASSVAGEEDRGLLSILFSNWIAPRVSQVGGTQQGPIRVDFRGGTWPKLRRGYFMRLKVLAARALSLACLIASQPRPACSAPAHPPAP